jgi:hypothetical protein
VKVVSNQQVAEHLQRLNPWWSGGGMDRQTLAMQPRAYLNPVLQLLRETNLRRAVVLLGPRRVGKSRHTRNWQPIGAVTLNPERDAVIEGLTLHHDTQQLAA